MSDLAFLDVIVRNSKGTGMSHAPQSRLWSEAEDRFLRENYQHMTDEELGRKLGRTTVAVHLRWKRDLDLPHRSKVPGVLTGRAAARLLGVDEHKISAWVDYGLIPGRIMPGAQTPNRRIHLVDQVAFRRWVLNPMHWMYFDPKKVRDPELKRMLKLRAKRWGDEWWTARQVADYHHVPTKNVEQAIYRGSLPSFRLPYSLGGRHHERAWSNHYVRRSDAVQAVFRRGKGSARITGAQWTPAADRWILKARDQLGMTFVHIGRTMKCGGEKWSGVTPTRSNPKVSRRYHQLKQLQKTRKRATK